jgi:hypothetical protein
LDENLGALRVAMSADDMKQIEDGFAAIQVQGARSTEQLLAVHDIGANLGSLSTGGHGRTPLPGTQT